MPTTTTITITYLDGSTETYTNCTNIVDTDAKIKFQGTLGEESALWSIPYANNIKKVKIVTVTT